MFASMPPPDPSLATSPLGQMPDLQSTDLQTPAVQPKKGGMFGGMTINPGNVIAGYLAGRFPQYAQSFLAPMMQREQMQMQMAHLGIQNQLEFQRQLALAQAQARLKLMYPDDAFSTAEMQGGVVPGSPQWVQDHRTRAQNELDPVVNVEGVGPMTRSQALSLQSAHAQTPAPPAIGTVDGGYRFKGGDPSNQSSWEPVGGPTQPASGHFLGS